MGPRLALVKGGQWRLGGAGVPHSRWRWGESEKTPQGQGVQVGRSGWGSLSSHLFSLYFLLSLMTHRPAGAQHAPSSPRSPQKSEPSREGLLWGQRWSGKGLKGGEHSEEAPVEPLLGTPCSSPSRKGGFPSWEVCVWRRQL